MTTLTYGDVIEIQDGTWALYVDNGEVVHLVLTGEKAMWNKDSLGKRKYDVKNKHCKPRGRREIKRSVQVVLERKFLYKIKGSFKQYSERCVMNLRYDFNETTIAAKPGDLIEMPHLTYSHWGVYVGNGYIVHLVADSYDPKILTGLPFSGFTGKIVSDQPGYIWRDRLIEYCPEENFNVYNELHRKRPHPVDQIIQDAEANAWKKYTYNLEKMNCEHFATWLRYGTALCTQVDKLKTAVAVGAVGAAVGASGVNVAPVVAGSLFSRALSWLWYSSSSSSFSSSSSSLHNQQYFVFAGKESGGSSS